MPSALARSRALLLALSAVLWMLGATAQQLHQLTVRHITCPEHGEVLELSAAQGDDSVGSAPQDLPSVSDATGDLDHDLGCGVPALVHAASFTHQPSWTAPDDAPLLSHPAAHAHPARGPPLAYAPKTSPPRLT